MMAHAKLSPSKRDRWSRCPGSVREEAKMPPDERSNPAAIDGTHTHTLVSMCVTQDTDPHQYVGQILSDPDGSFMVDPERADRALEAIHYVGELLQPATILSEVRVSPASLIGRDDMDGTVDILVYGSGLMNAGTLEVIDYKDGMGEVEVVGNKQLELYAVGALVAAGDREINSVKMTIIQPKMVLKGKPAITSHTVPVADVLALVPVLRAEGAAVDDPNAPLVPGDVQCKYCRARGSCSALANGVMRDVGMLFSPLEQVEVSLQAANKDPNTMTDRQIREVMEAAPLMRQFLDAVDEEALRRLKQGTHIDGLKVVYGRGSRQWALPEDQMEKKLLMMGIPKGSIWETKMISPAKAEKATWVKRDGTKKQLSERQLKTLEAEYITKTAGKMTVAPESDPRQAVTLNAAPLFRAVSAPVQPPAVENELPDWLR